MHLWVDNPPPWEYIRLILCRDVYHCTPLELEKIPGEIILQDLTMLGEEARVNKHKAENR